MKFLQKKYVILIGLSIFSLLVIFSAWKVLMNVDMLHLNPLAPKSYSRTNSSNGFLLVFLMPIIATGMLFLGLTWKKD